MREEWGHAKAERFRGPRGLIESHMRPVAGRMRRLLRPRRALPDVTFRGVASLSNAETNALVRVPLAGLMAWLVPGLGHILVGERGRGLVFFVTITATFWTGVAIGGVQNTVDPQKRKLWFVAQLFTGGNTVTAYALNRRVSQSFVRAGSTGVAGHWLSGDIGIHYTGVAGLLNLLVILDAVGRADPTAGRQRVRHAIRTGAP